MHLAVRYGAILDISCELGHVVVATSDLPGAFRHLRAYDAFLGELLHTGVLLEELIFILRIQTNLNVDVVAPFYRIEVLCQAVQVYHTPGTSYFEL